MTATMTEHFIVVADEGHKDVVLGSFADVAEARRAVDSYNSVVSDPFCWIERSSHMQN